MHKRYPRYSDFRFSTDPQNVLKFLQRSSKSSKSSEVHKRFSRRPQSPQKCYLTSSKSSVCNQCSAEILNILKSPWNPQRPQVLNRSTRSHQEVQKNLQCFEILRSTGLQKVLKRSTKSPKSQENSQKLTKVLRPQVLNWCSICPQIPSKGHQSPRSPQRSTKAIQGYLKVLKKFINVFKVLSM